MVRTDSHQLRSVAGDSPEAEAIKVVARAHKTLIWERTRHTQRLRHALREYFPAALEAFDDLDAVDALELLGKAPDPASAARLTRGQIAAALRNAHRRDIEIKTDRIQAALRGEQLGRATVIIAAYAATVRSAVAILTTLNTEIKALQEQVDAHFGRHPDAEIILSQPGLGPLLGEFGDDRSRYATAKARKNYAATSPITRAPGKKKTVTARFVLGRSARRCPELTGVLVPARFLRFPRLLRQTTRPWSRSQLRLTAAGQPARRHLAQEPTHPQHHATGPVADHAPARVWS